VDLEMFKKMLPKIYEAEKVVMSLLSTAGTANAHSCRAVIGEELGRVIGKDFSDLRITRKKDVDMVLCRLIEDPVGVAKELLARSISELVDSFAKSGRMYFYLVDEHAGVPVDFLLYNKKTKTNAETLKLLIPFLHFSMKTACATNYVSGLSQLFSIGENEVPTEWAAMGKYRALSFDKNSNVMELFLLQETVENYTMIGTNGEKPLSRTSLLALFENFLISKDQSRAFAGLKRVCGKDENFLLWARNVSNEHEQLLREEEINDLSTKDLDMTQLNMVKKKRTTKIPSPRYWQAELEKEKVKVPSLCEMPPIRDEELIMPGIKAERGPEEEIVCETAPSGEERDLSVIENREMPDVEEREKPDRYDRENEEVQAKMGNKGGDASTSENRASSMHRRRGSASNYSLGRKDRSSMTSPAPPLRRESAHRRPQRIPRREITSPQIKTQTIPRIKSRPPPPSVSSLRVKKGTSYELDDTAHSVPGNHFDKSDYCGLSHDEYDNTDDEGSTVSALTIGTSKPRNAKNAFMRRFRN